MAGAAYPLPTPMSRFKRTSGHRRACYGVLPGILAAAEQHEQQQSRRASTRRGGGAKIAAVEFVNTPSQILRCVGNSVPPNRPAQGPQVPSSGISL